jgi:hypothetical protein
MVVRAGRLDGEHLPRLWTSLSNRRRLPLRRPVELKQYAAGEYRDILEAAAITQSMSRKANY